MRKNVLELSVSERKKAETVAYLQGYLRGLEDASNLKSLRRLPLHSLSANCLNAIELNPPPATPGILFLPYSCAAGYRKAIADCLATPRTKWGMNFAQTSIFLKAALAQPV